MKVFLFLFVGLFYALSLKSQDQSHTEDRIQDLFKLEDNVTYEEFYENISSYVNDPLDINNASYENLAQLMILTPMQINHFLTYRYKAGKIISIYELQVIEGFDMNTIQLLLPLITIKNNESITSLWIKIKKNKNNYLIPKIDQAKNSQAAQSNYIGDNNKISLRYRNYQTNDFSIGFTIKKDAGEPIQLNLSKNYYLFDQTSFHAAVYNKKFVKAFLIGDYHLQFGQGLVVGGGINLGKGAETILNAKKMGNGIRPHTSSSEYGYFRGTAITYSYGKINQTIFVSHQGIDGNIDSTTNSFTKITTGYHRTERELQNRKNIMENVFGTNVTYGSTDNRYQIGFTYVNTFYSKPLSHTDGLYNHYAFSGINNYTIGLNFNYHWKNFNVFGETAMSESKGKGMVLGCLSSLTSKLETAVVIRNYEKNFHSFYANSFRENTTTINESGIYVGIKYKVLSNLILSLYYDRFSFPWLKYQVNAPSHGYEYFGRITYSTSKTSLIYFQYRCENKEENMEIPYSTTSLVLPRNKNNYLVSFETQTGRIKLRSRVQYSTTYTFSSSNGFAIIQDLEYHTPNIMIAARFSLFDTDFENRQYVYERNMTYSFSIPFYYGQGYRWYVLTKIKMIKKADLWLRLANTKKKTIADDIYSDFVNGLELNGMVMIKF